MSFICELRGIAEHIGCIHDFFGRTVQLTTPCIEWQIHFTMSQVLPVFTTLLLSFLFRTTSLYHPPTQP